MKKVKDVDEHRGKCRFNMERELRFKLLQGDMIVAQGSGQTVDMSSSGVAFITQQCLAEGALVELAISWPVLLGDSCPMRLIVFGRVVRSNGFLSACSIDKYEFRTQARRPMENPIPIRNDAMLRRWAEAVRGKPTEIRAFSA
jgi:hypothetical protein